MHRILICAGLGLGLAATTSAASAQHLDATQQASLAELAAAAGPIATLQPVRGAVRVDSTDVPFEVTIEPSALNADSSSIEVGADHWAARGYDLKALVAEVFEVDARLVNVPEEMSGAARRYDVNLSVPAELDQDSMRQVLVKALMQRFGLAIRPERRTMDVYVLSAPAGPASGLKKHVFPHRTAQTKLFADTDDDEGGRITYMGKDCSGVSSGGITVEGGTMADFRRTLEPDLDRVLVDETRLHGSYDFRIGLYANQRQLFELMHAALGLEVTAQQRMMTVLTVRPASVEPKLLQAKM